MILEIATAFAEHGMNAIPDTKALFDLRLPTVSRRPTWKRAFTNWGTMMRVLHQTQPELMALAQEKDAPKPKATPKPKAAAKPAAKPAVKKGKQL